MKKTTRLQSQIAATTAIENDTAIYCNKQPVCQNTSRKKWSQRVPERYTLALHDTEYRATLGKDLFYDLASDVGEPEVSTGVAVRHLFVVETH
ncbi:MAG: hypothetical protein JWM11_7262 [Planctomycetaceae bacterium]|nr:hypothetical protein [Planctomycetaceae bacterium]